MEDRFGKMWQAFGEWTEGKGGEFDTWEENRRQASSLQQYTGKHKGNPENEESVISETKQLMIMFQAFRKESNCKPDLFAFWDENFTTAKLLLQFIREERKGDWSVHLVATSEMIRFFYARIDATTQSDFQSISPTQWILAPSIPKLSIHGICGWKSFC